MNSAKKRASINPARMISESFAAVIVIGAILLWLPISSKSGEFTPLLSCVFTAASATCVTGLILFDTYTHWNAFGQGILMMLIQIGGLGLVTFTSFFNLVVGRKLGLRRYAPWRSGLDSTPPASGMFPHLLRVIITFHLNGGVNRGGCCYPLFCPTLWLAGTLDFSLFGGIRLLQRGI